MNRASLHRMFLVVLPYLLVSPSLAATAGYNDKLKAVLGIGEAELESCQLDSDCISISSFNDCCSNMSINIKYQDSINRHSNALRKEFILPAYCSLVECAPPLSKPACRQNKCVEVAASSQSDRATPSDFIVPLRKTEVNISSPSDGFVQKAIDPVYFSGGGYDKKDGNLSGSSLQWISDIQGALGSGSSLRIKLLPGHHKITLTAKASDGNSVSTSSNIFVAGQPPVIELNVRALNKPPTTCWKATINAHSGFEGADLLSVDYSLDNGKNYVNIPLRSLPYSFVLPGTGYVSLIARALDNSRQRTLIQEHAVYIHSACDLTTQSTS